MQTLNTHWQYSLVNKICRSPCLHIHKTFSWDKVWPECKTLWGEPPKSSNLHTRDIMTCRKSTKHLYCLTVTPTPLLLGPLLIGHPALRQFRHKLHGQPPCTWGYSEVFLSTVWSSYWLEICPIPPHNSSSNFSYIECVFQYSNLLSLYVRQMYTGCFAKKMVPHSES